MKKLKFRMLAALMTGMLFLTLAGCGASTNTAAVISDTDAVSADKASLVDAAITGANADLGHVTGDLTLPSSGDSGSTITWIAAPVGVIANDGVVTRPAFLTGDATITLTGTITKGTETSTVVFTITVLKIPPTDTEAVNDDIASLTSASIKGANDDLDHVTGNLTFPLTGSSGTTVSWSSDITGVIADDGSVTRPAFGLGDAAVEVTAAITKGIVSVEKKFAILVLETPQSDAEAVAADKASLVDDSIRNQNSNLSTVATNLTLPSTISSGTAITWSSDKTDVIADNGTVTQAVLDTTVIMTATIKKGSATDTKPFTIIVPGTGTPGLLYSEIGEPVTAYRVSKGTADTTGSVVILATYSGLPVTTIDIYAFKDCTTMTGITIPQSVTTINQEAFRNCTSLASVAIPSGVSIIASNAFMGCTALTGITIPSSVTSINSGAFQDCTSLAKVTLSSVIPPSLGYNCFYGCTNLTSFVVPAAGLSNYQYNYSYYSWYDFSSLISSPTTQLSIDAEKDKITVAGLGTLSTGVNALTKAQTLVSAGYIVSIESSSDIAVITKTDGSVVGVAGTSSNVVFRVSKDGFTSDTAALSLLIVKAWSVVGTSGFGNYADYPCMAFDSAGTPYIAYQDGSLGNYKVTVLKLNGTTWEIVGDARFSAGAVYEIDIAIDSLDTPYVTYRDNFNSNKATVMKLSGAAWVVVGSAGFSAGESFSPNIAFDSANTPYIVYTDYFNSNKATVMKLNGSAWEAVGSAGFSAGAANTPAIVIDSNNIPYVAFRDVRENNGKAAVMKFVGGNWISVGGETFTLGQVGLITISLDSANTPYVAFYDWDNSGKATVMKFTGTTWDTVGSAGFSDGSADFISIAMSSDTPYVAYSTSVYPASKTTVKKFNGSSWETVGAANFNSGSAQSSSMAIYSGVPYVVYSDGQNSSKAMVMKFQ